MLKLIKFIRKLQVFSQIYINNERILIIWVFSSKTKNTFLNPQKKLDVFIRKILIWIIHRLFLDTIPCIFSLHMFEDMQTTTTSSSSTSQYPITPRNRILLQWTFSKRLVTDIDDITQNFISQKRYYLPSYVRVLKIFSGTW